MLSICLKHLTLRQEVGTTRGQDQTSPKILRFRGRAGREKRLVLCLILMSSDHHILTGALPTMASDRRSWCGHDSAK